jgi:tRNA nucleotidyltransferase (CCA-adding enzyme)
MDTKLRQVYLVGGAVRDALLGVASNDEDYVVVAETVETMLSLGYQAIGTDFPVFLHPVSKDEYALARTERKSGSGYTGFTIDASISVTLEEDLARRDLTINSMARDTNNKIIDPYNGQTDLKNKILRHTTAAFSEDPVRVLRVARFLARYGEEWTIHPETYQLMLDLKDSGELDHLVPERVWRETEKALGEQHPHLFFKALTGLGIFPEVDVMQHIPQSAKHHPEGDVYKHTLLVVKRAADLKFDLETRFAALTHDFGKANCYLANGNLYGHEKRGLRVIKQFCDRLKVPNRFRNIALLTSDNHTKCHTIFALKPVTLHKLIVGQINALKKPEIFQQFLQACLCDAQGRGDLFVDKPYPQAQYAEQIVDQLNKLDRKKIIQQAVIDGHQGPAIGNAMRDAEINCISHYVKSFTA